MRKAFGKTAICLLLGLCLLAGGPVSVFAEGSAASPAGGASGAPDQSMAKEEVSRMENPGDEICVTGKVTEIQKHGHVELDITIEDFVLSGFDLGDIIAVKAGTFEGDLPYLSGYYTDRGEGLVRAYPGKDCIALCINYGSFAEMASLSVGDPVSLSLKEKAGALALQEASNLVYSLDGADYASDEIFANFRPVIVGKLYRSASPVDNRYNRAPTADRLMQEAGIRSVMNMADTAEEMAELLSVEENSSPYFRELYASGNVITLGMPTDYTSDGFGEHIVRGFTFLSEHEPPYLVHCLEGKDRTGFAAMLLEMLSGFSSESVIEDYMRSYVNAFHIDPGSEKYDVIVDKNIEDMMLMIAGLQEGGSLEGIDWKPLAEGYLLSHGMSEAALSALEAKIAP